MYAVKQKSSEYVNIFSTTAHVEDNSLLIKTHRHTSKCLHLAFLRLPLLILNNVKSYTE